MLKSLKTLSLITSGEDLSKTSVESDDAGGQELAATFRKMEVSVL